MTATARNLRQATGPLKVSTTPGETVVAGVPEGYDAFIVADVARQFAEAGQGSAVDAIFVARDVPRMSAYAEAAAFFTPDVEILTLPGWDCLPFDRVSPTPGVLSQRLATMARLVVPRAGKRPVVLATTVGAIMQRMVPRARVQGAALSLRPGQIVELSAIVTWLEANGFMRTGTVRESGEYAVRGGILDLFSPGEESPVRLDFFGDTLETIRAFDPETQRTISQAPGLDLVPLSEVLLDEETIRTFRAGYRSAFGATSSSDPVYEAISAGHRHQGMEHYLLLFYGELETIFDYCPQAPFLLDALSREAYGERHAQVRDHYLARKAALEEGSRHETSSYRPLDPDTLYMPLERWADGLEDRRAVSLNPYQVPETGSREVVDAGATKGRDFAPERQDEQANVFNALVTHLRKLAGQGKKLALACWSDGSRARLADMLQGHGWDNVREVNSFAEIATLEPREAGLAVLGLEAGFETDDFAIIGEQDVLGDRYARPRKKSRSGADILTEAASLTPGDYVVHVDHGIGRFIGLKTITVTGAPHDCVELHYANDDKLFLPVENIELLSRYGAEEASVTLDRLGSIGWQARKSKLKERIREMAAKLIEVAAARAMRTAPKIEKPDGLYDEFAARFPYAETDDQLQAIDSVLDDLASGRPMDRLVCGDVGFGKTEVALRAAFVAAAAGFQVAVVVPTTLLSRQHYKTFRERMSGFALNVAHASRLAGPKELAATKAGIKDGSVDIVVGTHALLGKSIQFKNLGLLIIDEEQHFGVAHKEKLKQLRADVHVLTLSATPIPRTLQLAMTGLRELSMIATPPVDRLAVRTYVSPFDPVILREALLRERYRGGQTFFVCPRIADLEDCAAFLRDSVPELKMAVAHGQLAPGDLDELMSAFYEGKYDVLLSTAIVESGLDVPTANTLIVYRADMFGLAQLYQLRGRVGRSKVRAYAYFTTPANRMLTPQAEKRLKVLQSLDSLGAGFMLASHDLDLRGAGNLLGEEQSGHIREVGYELYQAMLEEAVAALRSGDTGLAEDQWSPQISVGAPVLLPDHFVPDLDVRMQLYRRLSQVSSDAEVEAFGGELADRFGRLPDEVEDLLEVVRIKLLCLRAGVEKVEAGPMGVVVSFRDNRFANPRGLVEFVANEGRRAKVRPDHSILLKRDWPAASDRLTGTRRLLSDLAKLAEAS
ncbi:transcription-repair coupling factor [Tepidamorphus sp. 3E244]|uniref:transcription-repair coupling factor n=1 Tax=Tepidamorphus sp. 3E244 TaxID=3385498 RepID=UPI0038FD35CE